MKTMRSLLLSCLFACLAVSTAAQPLVRVTSIRAVRNETQATARLSIRCNGEAAHGITASNLTLIENGSPVTGFAITNSPSDDTRQAFEVMLCLDVSGSMIGQGIDGLKNASHALVQFMDPSTDRIGIVAFNQLAQLVQDFTSDTDTLDARIDGLVPQGATAIYDGAVLSLQYLIAQNDTTAEAVILMSDGGDNSSSHTPQQVIALAQQHGKRVHTIALGTAAPTPILQMIADSTGGLFFNSPSAQELQQIFTEIASFMRVGYQEYTIRYDVPDPSADRRTLEVHASAPPCDGIGVGLASRPVLAGVTSSSGVPAPALFAITSIAPHPVLYGIAQVQVTMHESARPLAYEIIDLLGRSTGVRGSMLLTPGAHTLRLDLGSLPPGAYVVRMQVGAQSLSRPLLVGSAR